MGLFIVPGVAIKSGMSRLERFLFSPWFAAALLIFSYVMAVTALKHKSVTFDEIGHLTGGYSIWWKNDYRLVPDNGNLSQRWAAIPALWRKDRFPSMDQSDWHVSNVFSMGDQFFYKMGNDADALLWSGRAMMGLIIVAIGALIYFWSRSLFGPTGALVSVVLWSFCPTVLAHGALVTSDMMVSLFFFTTIGILWRLLHRVSIWNVLLLGLSLLALFLSKLSGVFIIPMGLFLALVRLTNPEPLPVQWPGLKPVRSILGKASVYAGVILINVFIVWIGIWAAFSFRYSAFAHNDLALDRLFPGGWVYALEKPGFVSDTVRELSIGQWFPEPFLFGAAMISRAGSARQCFLNGEFGIYGFHGFFPYAFMVKETLPFLILLAIGVAALVITMRAAEKAKKGTGQNYLRQRAYATAPLWILIFIYAAFSLTSNLNIGHRHLLPLYPPVFVLAGAAGAWLSRRSMKMGTIVTLLLCWHVTESLAVRPDYLAYFNELAGGSSNGYKHLVDSSLDWGQDLPALKDWLHDNKLEDGRTPVYLLYFGMARQEYYHINAIQLPGYDDRVQIGLEPMKPLSAGVYCISATLYDSVYLKCYGPWTQRYESAYRAQQPIADEITRASGNTEELKKLETRFQDQGLRQVLYEFPRLRVARLCAWLRDQQRRPNAEVGHSILIFKLSDEDIHSALDGNVKTYSTDF